MTTHSGGGTRRALLARFLCWLVLAAGPAAAEPAAPRALGSGEAAATGKGRLVARIGPREIHEADLGGIVEASPLLGRERPGVLDDGAKAFFVRQYVTDEVLWRKAGQPKLTGTPQAMAMARHDAAMGCVNAEIDRRMRADPPSVEDYYREHIRAFTQPNRARVRALRLPTREKAAELLQRLDRGEDFGALAERESAGVAGAGRDGRLTGLADDWGYVPGIGSFPAATQAIFALAPGQVTPQPLERAGAWFVFRLEEVIPAKNPPLDEIRAKVTEACLDTRRKELKPVVIRDALQEAQVEFYLGPAAR